VDTRTNLAQLKPELRTHATTQGNRAKKIPAA
jgi:hypothetical protein